MDKYEYSLKLEQLKALCLEEKYDEAAEVADSINWNKVKEAGIEYAIIRVGYRGGVTGTLVEDKYFKQVFL